MDPYTPSTIFAKAGGPLFKTTNAGASWTLVLNVSLLSVAIDPVTPSTIYAGSSNQGVLKSTDGGANWTSILLDPETSSILSLAIDPVTPDTVYAGSHLQGVYKSIDGGATWSTVNTGLTTITVYSLAIDPSSPTTVYAGTYDKLFKTINGGSRVDTAEHHGPDSTSVLLHCNRSVDAPLRSTPAHQKACYEAPMVELRGGFSLTACPCVL